MDVQLIQLMKLINRDSESGSEVVFGGVDPSHYEGQINWVPVQHNSHWQLVFEG